MEWFAAVVSLIVLWIASLCKILHTSTNKGGALINKNVLLVIAHPDDESMFFSPTISFLISRGNNLRILCLSIGDADGLGKTRKDELCRACAVLQVPLQQVKVLNHPELQDGFGLVWDHNLMAQIIEEEVSAHEINMIITFDKYGVSGHCNHRDVHYGVRKVMHHIPQRSIEAWELVSINILRKYSGPVDIWLSMLFAITSKGTHCLQNEHTSRSFHAMAAHSSQWVWFRKLFVSFSSYTYVNSLRKINYGV
ncbi:hypothetical protein K2173_027142 [Erythroxylum novogranatense]|uniref:N-acetylglucosaminylphosphatidylinositol deacetylase n=1 Tax=Erythroxylum novogranatense TaxID=1862640 RepID=A0AAV8U0S4_9ROSI|nr:hypothetical protein K2173_027142 [Erythroxylum novogranatense]